MGLVSPEHQWPPQPDEEHDERIVQSVFEQTRALLIESRQECASILHNAGLNNLILQILDSEDEQRPFALHHGMFHPSAYSPTFFVVKPDRSTLDMLNGMPRTDIQQLAGMLCFDYLVSKWKDEQAPYEEEMTEDEDDDEDDAPWRTQYEWEKNLSVSGYKDDEEEGEDELEVEDVTNDPDFWIFAAKQTELRKLYEAILGQQLSGNDVLLVDE